MANNKTYTVMKDGDVLKELKTLAAARKLADAEDAEVFCEGLCIYAPDPAAGEDVTAEPDAADIAEPVVETVTAEKYTLIAKMNVRKAPSLDAEKIGIAQRGTVVDVTAVEDGWLHLLDGSFILYEGGRFAVRN